MSRLIQPESEISHIEQKLMIEVYRTKVEGIVRETNNQIKITYKDGSTQQLDDPNAELYRDLKNRGF